MTPRTLACIWLVSLSLLLAPVSAFAQGTQINETRLKSLYQSQLSRPTDTYVQQLITQEKEKIRKLAENEVKAIIEGLNEELSGEGEAALTVSDKQRQIISKLEETISAWRVDLDLLNAEEKKYYGPGTEIEEVDDPAKITATYPELLAKKAILEQRIEVGNSVLDLERDRLKKLVNEQRFEQFGLFINAAKYVLIVLLIVVIDRILRNVFLASIHQSTRRYIVTKLTTTVLYMTTLLWLLSLLFAEHPGIITSFAIVGAGIAVALQDVVKDVMGWLMILQGGLFARGDRISIGAYTGEVVDFTILRTTLLEVNPSDARYDALERTGKTMSIPNAKVLTERVLNYNATSDYTKAEMQVVVALESDWRMARDLLRDITQEETKLFIERDRQQHTHRTRRFYVPHEPGDSKMYMEIGNNGVDFTLRLTIPIGERREVVTRITERILDAFEKAGIELAYTTVRSTQFAPVHTGKLHTEKK